MKQNLKPMLALGACLAFSSVTAEAENHPIGVAVKTTVANAPSVPPSGAFEGLFPTDLTVGTFYGTYPQYSSPFFLQPIPIVVTKTDAPIITTLQLQDLFYTGTPTLTYTFMQAGVLLSTSSYTFPFTLAPYEEASGSFADKTPDTVGPAVIVVIVTSGTQTIGTMTTHLDIL